MSESFIMYKSFHEALKELSREQYGNVMYAINEYALNGEESELTGIEKAVFMLIKPQIDANARRRENGRNGGRPQKEKPMVSENTQKEKPMVSENAQEEKPNVNVNVNVNANANENVNANVNENECVSDETHGFSDENPRTQPEQPSDPPKKQRFVKPTVEEIAAYCAERQNGIDARTFFEYYESKGWLIGSSRMKDWRASVRTWELRRKTEQMGGRNKAGAMWGRENEVPEEYLDMM